MSKHRRRRRSGLNSNAVNINGYNPSIAAMADNGNPPNQLVTLSVQPTPDDAGYDLIKYQINFPQLPTSTNPPSHCSFGFKDGSGAALSYTGNYTGGGGFINPSYDGAAGTVELAFTVVRQTGQNWSSTIQITLTLTYLDFTKRHEHVA